MATRIRTNVTADSASGRRATLAMAAAPNTGTAMAVRHTSVSDSRRGMSRGSRLPRWVSSGSNPHDGSVATNSANDSAYANVPKSCAPRTRAAAIVYARVATFPATWAAETASALRAARRVTGPGATSTTGSPASVPTPRPPGPSRAHGRVLAPRPGRSSMGPFSPGHRPVPRPGAHESPRSLVMAALFLCMSADEVGQLHEKAERITGIDWQTLFLRCSRWRGGGPARPPVPGHARIHTLRRHATGERGRPAAGGRTGRAVARVRGHGRGGRGGRVRLDLGGRPPAVPGRRPAGAGAVGRLDAARRPRRGHLAGPARSAGGLHRVPAAGHAGPGRRRRAGGERRAAGPWPRRRVERDRVPRLRVPVRPAGGQVRGVVRDRPPAPGRRAGHVPGPVLPDRRRGAPAQGPSPARAHGGERRTAGPPGHAAVRRLLELLVPGLRQHRDGVRGAQRDHRPGGGRRGEGAG